MVWKSSPASINFPFKYTFRWNPELLKNPRESRFQLLEMEKFSQIHFIQDRRSGFEIMFVLTLLIFFSLCLLVSDNSWWGTWICEWHAWACEMYKIGSAKVVLRKDWFEKSLFHFYVNLMKSIDIFLASSFSQCLLIVLDFKVMFFHFFFLKYCLFLLLLLQIVIHLLLNSLTVSKWQNRKNTPWKATMKTILVGDQCKKKKTFI